MDRAGKATTAREGKRLHGSLKGVYQMTAAEFRARRIERQRRERRERAQVALGAIVLIGLLAAFAVAGAMDWRDRAVTLAPSAEWQWTACREISVTHP